MPTCSAVEFSVPVHINYCKNCTEDKRYKAYHQLNQDQFYEGEFFRDSLHGQGTYTWKNVAVYEGGFYSNSKEGYASLSLADNSHFEGLFVRNQPFGPGILTYANGRQDAGFWVGRKLIRLGRALDYIIPRLASTPTGKIKLLQFKRLLPLNEEFYDSTIDIREKFGCQTISLPIPYSTVIYDPRSQFFDRKIFDKTFFTNESPYEFIKDRKYLENGIREDIEWGGKEEDSDSLEIRVPSHCKCQGNVFEMQYENVDEEDICEMKSIKGELEIGILGYFTKLQTIEGLEENEEVEESQILQNDEEDDSKCPKILLWNRSELCKKILKHMFRHRGFEEKLNFNLSKLMLGVRTAFRRTGEKEKQCLQFLKMCSLGPPFIVKDLLCSYEISQDLTDGRGNNGLMFAAATDQHQVMDILLDYGVDINNFNDEGLTPLNLSLLRRLALTSGISSWETAFLPPETDKNPDNTLEEEFKTFQSIESLDRIFGDGMSAKDSRNLIQESELQTLQSTTAFQMELYQSLKAESLIDNFNHFNLSQISLFNLLKSPKSSSLFAIDEENKQSIQKINSFCSFQTIDPLQKVENNESTIQIKFVPKQIKRDEYERSIKKESKDRYLFEFTFKKNPNLVGSKKEKERSAKSSKAKSSRVQEKQKEENKENYMVDMEQLNLELNTKLAEIDKTIEKLLKRGADPNISEVPKPSIHLGIYTKDMKTICTLFKYGASPNSQLYPNKQNDDRVNKKSNKTLQEGLLTPLHVIVLMEPIEINVQICDLLLYYKANPELETSPDFSICEEEKNLLSSKYGRTPLQLLCMRPDLEYADPCDILIRIGLLLATVSDKRHFYNGHSCLTLAMLSGNFKILKALLECKCFNPNDILGNDRGTALHVLVSAEMQKITSYENIIKMCDLLIANGADPLKKFSYPKKLIGTCIDHGYREIEAEKEARKAATPNVGKKEPKGVKVREKTPGKEYILKDHERVLDYLGKIAANMAKDKETVMSKDKTVMKKSNKTQDFEGGSEKDGRDITGKDKDKKGKDFFSIESQEKIDSMYSGKTDKKKDKESEKINKNSLGEFETAEKKEIAKIKNERTSLENKSELKSKKTKKQEYEKAKLSDKKENDRNKLRNKRKIETHATDKINTKNLRKSNGCKSHCPRADTFPEKIRQIFIKLYGTRFHFDVNELLMPYVVLRNGELYYRFHKKSTGQKEQYSLI